MIGRVLVLSKLEEAAMLRATTSEESFKGAKCFYMDAAGAFDKKMDDIVYQWRCHLRDVEPTSWKTLKGNEDIVHTMVGKVTRYVETFMAKEVELSVDHKRKQETESDDICELEEELKHKKRLIDMEVEARGTIMNPNQM
jgi:hypothetical protein